MKRAICLLPLLAVVAAAQVSPASSVSKVSPSANNPAARRTVVTTKTGKHVVPDPDILDGSKF